MVLPFATVRRVMPDKSQWTDFLVLSSESYAEVYPLRFTAEGGQEKYEQFFQQFNDAMHK
jgi:hypothetical protein